MLTKGLTHIFFDAPKSSFGSHDICKIGLGLAHAMTRRCVDFVSDECACIVVKFLQDWLTKSIRCFFFGLIRLPLMLSKRTVWTAEQRVACAFFKYLSRV